MAIISNSAGMNSDGYPHENGTPTHAHDVFLDRQLQNRLLQAAEDAEAEAYENKLSISKPTGNIVNNAKPSISSSKVSKTDSQGVEITGWFPNAKFVPRRANDIGAKGDNQNVRSARDSFIHPWKDPRSKRDDNFNFKHYSDHQKYIEQYRRDHGCLNNRYSSGNQLSEMRRVAFQTSAPPQPQTQNAVQVSLQQIQQGTSNGASNGVSYQPGFQYSNRKEQLGTLQVMQGPPATAICSCKPSGHSDSANHHHRYKMSHPPGHVLRTNTDMRGMIHGENSDNSSESGDLSHPRTPTRRISSATSSRSNQRPGKAPTKITVPANPRAYPLHALTIAWRIQQQLRQQNGKSEVQAQSKPLDNLNCVAPEKQPLMVGKKPIEPLGVALRVQSLQDILSTHETPMRGYALPKSTPPNPVTNNDLFKRDPEFDGLTWPEKLEILRAVNKRPAKPKPRKPKLKYVSEDTPADDKIWSPEEEQIYEQRRIRHLLEQARVKGGKQYDWVHDAQLRATGIDWATGKMKFSTGDTAAIKSENTCTTDEVDLSDEEEKFKKYGISAPTRLSSSHLFEYQQGRRSNTFLLP